MRVSLLLLFAVTGAAQADPVAAILQDARALPPAVAVQTRYLTLDTLPVVQRQSVRQAVAFWANSLSSQPDIVTPRLVGADVLAVRLDDYGWKAEVWDRLATVDPYFSVRLISTSKTKMTAAAPWLSIVDMASLYRVTGSKAPILRADWWLHQVSVQEDRVAGYYDFLGVPATKAELLKFAAVDNRPNRRELAAIVKESAVAYKSRQIKRAESADGAFWETLDNEVSVGQNNALRFLNGDYKFTGQEMYFTLPNGLFGFSLNDGQGKRVNIGPQKLVRDSQAHDANVLVGRSCVTCHVEGLRPIRCWARETFTAPEQLLVLGDDLRARRIHRLYLSPELDWFLDEDRKDYAHFLRRTNGLTPGDNAKVFAAVLNQYEAELTVHDVAREMGTTQEKLVAALRARGLVDLALTPLGKEQPDTLLREHAEELWPVLMGLKP